MLTQEEMDEYVDMAERDEWDPDRWKFAPNPRRRRLVLVYDVNKEQEARIVSKARERGMSSSEYLGKLLSEALEG